jgi:hypothetical protein
MSTIEEITENLSRAFSAVRAFDGFPALTEEQGRKVAQELVEEEAVMIEIAREEYSSGQNIFANFNRAADRLGISPEKVLMVYLLKHMDGILSWTTGRAEQREGIEDRIKDLRNYLGILYQMVHARANGKLSEEPEGLAIEQPDRDERRFSSSQSLE